MTEFVSTHTLPLASEHVLGGGGGVITWQELHRLGFHSATKHFPKVNISSTKNTPAPITKTRYGDHFQLSSFICLLLEKGAYDENLYMFCVDLLKSVFFWTFLCVWMTSVKKPLALTVTTHTNEVVWDRKVPKIKTHALKLLHLTRNICSSHCHQEQTPKNIRDSGERSRYTRMKVIQSAISYKPQLSTKNPAPAPQGPVSLMNHIRPEGHPVSIW